MTRLGSIVLYRLHERDIDRIKQVCRERGLWQNAYQAGEQVPMVINRDWAPHAYVNGKLLLDADFDLLINSVSEGPEPAQWQAREA